MKIDNLSNCLTPDEEKAFQEIQAKIAAARKEKAKVSKKTYEAKRRNAKATVLVRMDKALHDHAQTDEEKVSVLLREVGEAAANHALQSGLSFRQAIGLAMGQFSERPTIALATLDVRLDESLRDHAEKNREKVRVLIREIGEAAAIHALQNGLSFREALDLAMGQFFERPTIDPSVIDALS